MLLMSVYVILSFHLIVVPLPSFCVSLSLCFAFVVSLPGDDVLCWLSSCPFSSVCLSFFLSERVPGLIWFGPIYLVTTTGFVSDQLMRDEQQTNNNNNRVHAVAITLAMTREHFYNFFIYKMLHHYI